MRITNLIFQPLILTVLVFGFVAHAETQGTAVASAPYNPVQARGVEGLENRIRGYLGNYLLPSEYSVVVRSKARPQGARPSEPKASLPGAPGFADSTQPGLAHSYYDEAGSFHESSDDRPAVAVDIVIDSKVESGKLQIFRRTIPKLAGFDSARGDEISILAGQLERTPPKETPKPPEPTFIDSIMRYKRELTSLALGLLAAVAGLLLLHGLLNAFANKVKRDKTVEKSPAPKPDPKGNANSDENGRSPGRIGNDRTSKFSRETVLQSLIKEIHEEAAGRPDKMARLISDWINEGKMKQAGAFLNNFDMKATEKIAEHLTTADVERIRPFMTSQNDPFAEENYSVMNEARQDLIRITTKMKSEANRQQFAFLHKLEDAALAEFLRTESPMAVAMVSTFLPANRLSLHLKNLGENETHDFFASLCGVNQLPPENWTTLAEDFRKKMEAWQGGLVTETSKNETILGLLHHLPGAEMQRKVLQHLERVSPEVAKSLRESVFFFEDVIQFSDKILKAIFFQLDGTILSCALTGLDGDTVTRLKQVMPKATADIVKFDRESNRQFTPSQISQARGQVVGILQGEIAAGRVLLRDAQIANPLPTIGRAA